MRRDELGIRSQEHRWFQRGTAWWEPYVYRYSDFERLAACTHKHRKHALADRCAATLREALLNGDDAPFSGPKQYAYKIKTERAGGLELNPR